MAHTSAASATEPTTTVTSDLETPSSPKMAHMDSAESSDSISHRVFETEELLENILSFLPANNIFTVQRVSKHWKAAIASSPSIQRKLFLRSTSKKPETWLDTSVKADKTKHRRIAASLIPFLRNRHRCVYLPVVLTPLVEIGRCNTANRAIIYFDTRTSAVALNDQHISLWDTLVCDPPCHRAEVSVRIWIADEYSAARNRSKMKYLWEADLNVRSDTGLKMGDLVKAALEARGEVWLRSRADDTKIGKCDHEWTTVQDAIDEFRRRCPMSRYSKSLCMDFDVHPEDERDDRRFSRSRVYIASEVKRAAVDAIYASKGEPAKLLRRDEAKVWKPLVTGLHNRLRK
jgi:hypothetical protein